MHCTGCVKYYVAKRAHEHCYGEKQRLIITQETLQERVSTTLCPVPSLVYIHLLST